MKALFTAADDRARRGYLLVLAATLCWATSGTFIKIIRHDYGLSAWTLAFYRDLFTFVIFLTIAVVLGVDRLRVARRDLIPLAAMGAISIGIFHVLWAMAVAMLPVAVATVLNYTAPVFVVLFAWALWHEEPDRRQTVAVIVAFVGCVLVTGAYNIADMNLNWLGLLVGLSTGLTYGMFTIFGKNALRRYDSWTVLTYAFGFATATLLVMQPRAMLEMFAKPLSAWLWVIALVVLSTVAGFGLYTSGLKYLSASSASIAATLEPVIATGFAFALLGEVIEPVQMAGGILVIISVIILAVKKDAPTNLVSTP
ncbi:MAG TPA: EamA family transporter [Anaerolineales bacterium]|nr:EamA family transporter [Anaerolineales bacterium]